MPKPLAYLLAALLLAILAIFARVGRSEDPATPPPAITAAASQPAETLEEKTCREIREAFEKGGPLASCWNVQAGWNLTQQVAWIRAGNHYFPTVYVPLLSQFANNPKRWERYLEEHREALDFIRKYRLPITGRWHNWGSDFTSLAPEERGPFEASPLIHNLRADGSLNSDPLIDPLGPLEPWSAEGKALATSHFLNALAAYYPDPPRVYFLENNEASVAELGAYTTPTSERDAWRFPLRAWRDNLPSISLRMADHAALHPDPNQLEATLSRAMREKYEALTAALLENAPPQWRGRIYTGGYAGLNPAAGLNRQPFDHQRPQEDFAHSPFGAAVWQFTEPSDRVYDDGSGSPWNWHDWLRSPHALNHNNGPLTRYLAATRPLWHEDRSFWLSPTRGREAARPDENGEPSHGGYVLPDRLFGFARVCLWSDRPKNRATNLRWFAASQVQLSDEWYANATKDPPEVRGLTQADYFAKVQLAVDEVWTDRRLLKFWREADPVINPDPALCDWRLPASIPLADGTAHQVIDDRSRVLYTDADPPRYDTDAKGEKIDTWRESDGRRELRVFAQAYRLADSYLIIAYSPRQVRENVTVQVPGFGPVTIPEVGPAGAFHFAGAPLPEPAPEPAPDPTPDPLPPPTDRTQRAAALLREALELLETP